MKNMLFLSILTVQIAIAQESQNLSFLEDSWSISYNESSDSILVLRNIKDFKFLTKEDKKVIYPFELENDSVLCEIDFPTNKGREFYCLVGSSNGVKRDLNDIKSVESWVLDKNESLLKHAICSRNMPSQRPTCVYEAIYEIHELAKGYLKLTLRQELVYGL